MSNKQEQDFWEQMKAVEKRKAKWLFTSPNPSLNEKPKKKNQPLLVWGGTLVLFIVIYMIVSLFSSFQTIPAIAEINTYTKNDMNEQVIHDYLIQTQGLSVEITQHLNAFSDTTKEEGLTIEGLKNMKKELGAFKEKAKTDVSYLVPLQNYYVNQVQLEEKMLDLMIKEKENKGFLNAFKIREWKKDYNANVLIEQDIIVALFEKAGIYHEIKEDGSLYYEIGGSENR